MTKDGALVPVPGGESTLVAAATLDGIAGAAIWARNIPRLKSILFSPEGQTQRTFAMPALSSPEFARRGIYCLSLTLAASDLESLSEVLQRAGTIRAVWLDHHHMHREHVARLRLHGVQVVNDTTHESCCSLLLHHLGDSAETDQQLCRMARCFPEQLDEPWRSWAYVILAVQPEPFGIRQAIQPLIDGRLLAYDPELRLQGEMRWQDILEYAQSSFHRISLGNDGLMVVGLASTNRIEYRLLADEVMRHRDATLCLIFFDDLPQLILRATNALDTATWIDRLEIELGRREMQIFLYDRNTIFLEPAAGGKRQVVEQAIEAITAALS